MSLVALRLLAVGILVGLYMVHPIAGIAALAAGWGYVAWQYRSRRGAPTNRVAYAMNLSNASRFTLL